MTLLNRQNFKRPGQIGGLVALLLLTGCAGLKNRPALNYQQATWFDIARAAQQNLARLHTMRGAARLSFEAANSSQAVSAQVLLKAPDSVAIKVEAIFGIDVALLMADADSVRIYSPFQKSLYIARTDSLDFRRFFAVDLSYQELLESITGIEQVTDSCVVKRKDGQLVCYTSNSSGTTISLVDPILGVIIRSDQMNRDGLVLQRREYSRFERINNVVLPKTIRISRPHQNQRITIFYTELTVNERIDPHDFDLRLPANTVRVVL